MQEQCRTSCNWKLTRHSQQQQLVQWDECIAQVQEADLRAKLLKVPQQHFSVEHATRDLRNQLHTSMQQNNEMRKLLCMKKV